MPKSYWYFYSYCLRELLPRTDRILWKGNGIEQLCYRSHPQLQISDHKPVTSLLRSGVKVVDRDKERRVYEEIMKQLDKQENEYLPQVNRCLIGTLNFSFIIQYSKLITSKTWFYKLPAAKATQFPGNRNLFVGASYLNQYLGQKEVN